MRITIKRWLLWVTVIGGIPSAYGAGQQPLGIDPFAYILVELGVLLGVVVAGHLLARRLNLPKILGELLIGLVFGNLLYWSELSPLFFLIMHLGDANMLFREVWVSGASVVTAALNIFPPEELEPGGLGDRLISILVGDEGPGFLLMGSALWHFSNLGILFLLFKVALDVRLDELVEVGPESLRVALWGGIGSLALGWVASFWLLPESSWTARFLLASGLVSTSASISLALMPLFRRRFTQEAKILVGAVLLDDVLAIGLISVASSLVQSGGWLGILADLLGVGLFFFGVYCICRKAPTWELAWMKDMEEYQAKLLLPLGLAFIMAWFADLLGLSGILGVFGAGLILNSLNLEERCEGRVTMQDLITPLEKVFAPIFFVLMGMQINLASLFSLKIVGMALLLMIVAMGAKLLAARIAVPDVRGWVLGWAMVPRGEIAMIVVALAKGFGLLTDDVYAAFVMMMVGTMLIAPYMLQRRLSESVMVEKERSP